MSFARLSNASKVCGSASCSRAFRRKIPVRAMKRCKRCWIWPAQKMRLRQRSRGVEGVDRAAGCRRGRRSRDSAASRGTARATLVGGGSRSGGIGRRVHRHDSPSVRPPYSIVTCVPSPRSREVIDAVVNHGAHAFRNSTRALREWSLVASRIMLFRLPNMAQARLQFHGQRVFHLRCD